MEICKVSEIDYAKGLIKVEFPAKDNIVSSWITFPANEYEMPEVGDLVKVEFEPDAYGNPYTSGICYQKCFNKDELPKMQGKDLFYKTMKGDLILIYDRAKKRAHHPNGEKHHPQGVGENPAGRKANHPEGSGSGAGTGKRGAD